MPDPAHVMGSDAAKPKVVRMAAWILMYRPCSAQMADVLVSGGWSYAFVVAVTGLTSRGGLSQGIL